MKENTGQTGVVTFLDVLGWKGVYERQTNAIQDLKLLLEGVTREAEEKRGRLNSNVIIRSISDTIAIFTHCNEDEASKAIEIHGELCQWLIPESIQAALPMRGATSYGEFEINDNIFVGKAVDEAASWHEQGNWIGVNLSPSADFIFTKGTSSTSAWIKYSAPIKVSMRWAPYCVNWLSNWTGVMQEKKKVLDMFRGMGPVVPEIAPKFINTLHFIDEMTKKPPRKRFTLKRKRRS